MQLTNRVIAHSGVFGVSTWPIGCDTPSLPPFLSVSPLESPLKWRCDTTPPSKGVSQRYLRKTLWKQGKWVRHPPLRCYLERVFRDMGGYLALAAKTPLLLVQNRIALVQETLGRSSLQLAKTPFAPSSNHHGQIWGLKPCDRPDQLQGQTLKTAGKPRKKTPSLRAGKKQ